MQVRAITGETYMLNSDEELWSKQLSLSVEELLASEKDPLADRGTQGFGLQSMPVHQSAKGAPGSQTGKARDKTRVVTFRVPHNAAVQIYDYKEKKARYGHLVSQTVYIYFKFILSISTTNISYCLGFTSILDIVAIIIQILLPDLSHVDIHKVSAPSVLRLLRK